MTTATAIRPPATRPIDIHDLRRTVRTAIAATDDLDLTDPVWAELASHVDEFEQVLGRAVGLTPIPTPPDAAPIVRMRALAVAGRRLLPRDVRILDAAAASRATELAGVIARAGVTGTVIAPR